MLVLFLKHTGSTFYVIVYDETDYDGYVYITSTFVMNVKLADLSQYSCKVICVTNSDNNKLHGCNK